MARRLRRVGHNEVITVTFGADSGELRIKTVQTIQENVMVAVTVNSATDPDLSLNSDDDDTFFVPEDMNGLAFTESAPSGPWEVRLQSKGGSAIVQLTDDS